MGECLCVCTGAQNKWTVGWNFIELDRIDFVDSLSIISKYISQS